MKDTVMDKAFRIILLKIGYTESDIREAFFGGNHGRV